MKALKIVTGAALVVGLMGAGGAAYAQIGEPVREARADRMEGMSMMDGCPMMRAHMSGPAAALKHGEALELTDAQIRDLEMLRDAMSANRQPAMERMMEAHRQLTAATEQGQFDEARARAALERMSGLHTEMAMGMLRTRARVQEILTPQQRTELDELSGGMMQGGMMRMMMRMMMDGDSMGGMMRGGGMEGMEGMEGMGGMGMMDMMAHCPMMGGMGGADAGGER